MGLINSGQNLGSGCGCEFPVDTVLVSNINDLPTPVGDDIQLSDFTTYDFQLQNFTLNYNLIIGNQTRIIKALITTDKSIKSADSGGNIRFFDSQIVFTGTTGTPFDFTDFSFLRLQRFNLFATGGTDLLNIDTTNDGIFGGTITMNEVFFGGLSPSYMDAVGTIQNASIDIDGLRVINFADGFKFIDNATISIEKIAMFNGLNSSGSRMFDFSGSIPSINISRVGPQPKSNEKIFYFNPSLVFNSILVNDASIKLIESGVTTANIFDTGSLDQTDINVTMNSNTFIPDSTSDGDIYFLNNSETTIISVISTAVAINATWSIIDVQRFVLEHLLDYDTQTTDFTVGQILTQGSVTGTITADNDTGTSGTLTLENVTGGSFQSGSLITDALGGSANLVKTKARLKYVGTQDVRVLVTALITLRPSLGVNIRICVVVAKNGTIINQSKACDVVSSVTGNERTIPTQATVDLSTDDYIEIYVSNDTNTNDIEVLNATFIAKK